MDKLENKNINIQPFTKRNVKTRKVPNTQTFLSRLPQISSFYTIVFISSFSEFLSAETIKDLLEFVNNVQSSVHLR